MKTDFRGVASKLVLLFYLTSTQVCVSKPVQIYMDADPLATSSSWLENWKPTFEEYLNGEVSRAMGVNVTFQLHHYDGSTPMETLVEKGLIDFYYGGPNVAACLQSTYSASPILTIRKPMPGGGNSDAYGGAIVVSASNQKINTVEDIKGAIVGVQLQSGWASNLLQETVLTRHGIDLFRDSKQVISGDISSSFAQLQILKSVQSGLLDVGFVRADNLYIFQTRGQIQQSNFKVVGQIPNIIAANGDLYPFPISTKLYPEWALVAYPTVDRLLKINVLEALIRLNSSSPAATRAGYASWELPLDYMAVEQVLQDTNLISEDPSTGRRQCQWLVKGYREYDSPSCPAGTFKVTEAEAVANCRLKNLSCIGSLHCWCGVCKQAAEYEVSLHFRSGEGRQPQSASCSKMQVCASIVQGVSFQATLLDNMLRSGLNVSYRVTNLDVLQTTVNDGHFQPARFSWVYDSENITLSRLGLYSVEVSVNGAQIASSPYLVSVAPAQCGALRAADDLGNCQCAAGAVSVGGNCVMLEVILFSVFFPIAGILVACNCYLRYRIEDISERTLRHMVVELRKRLKIHRRDGFVLSTERVSSSTVAIICKSHMEAAARLALWQDFDVKHFDAFCVCLQRDAVDEDVDAVEKPSLMRTASHYGRDHAKKCPQYRLLQQWLLDISRELLDPGIDAPAPQDFEQSSRKFGPSVYGSSSMDHGGVIDRSSQEQRYRYFQEKLIQCQIWRDCDNSLLRQLKGIAQGLMNVVAQHCDARYSELGNDPEGDALVSYESLGLSIAPDIPDVQDDAFRRRFPLIEDDFAVSRQDHVKIGAIRVLESDKVEAVLLRKMAVPASFRAYAIGSFSISSASFPNEEVFACQLSMRAHLLNEAFQAKVAGVVRKHSVRDPDADDRVSIDISPPGSGSFGGHHSSQSFLCQFKDGTGPVEVYAAPIKKISRMREKAAKYAPPHPRGVWPLTANILDPVRSAVVCNGPSQILEVQRWFTEDAGNGLPVCRIKNKFARSAVVEDGYRDLSLSVAFIDHSGLRIIGEVQIHDMQMHHLKLQMHKFYTIKRAADAGGLAG